MRRSGFKGLLERQLEYKIGMEKVMLQKDIKDFESNPSLRKLDDMMQLVSPHIPRYYPGQTTYERFSEACIGLLIIIPIMICLIYSLYCSSSRWERDFS